MKLLVVCIGNICRSPYAAAEFTRLLPMAQVQSAGLNALVGFPADEPVQQLAREQGIDLSAHVAQALVPALVRGSELIFVMSQQQQDVLVTDYPEARGRVFRLGHWQQRDIPDPYRQELAVHQHVQHLIRDGVAAWSQRLLPQMAPRG